MQEQESSLEPSGVLPYTQQSTFDFQHIPPKPHYGNYYILMRKSNGKPILLLGPHWYFFIVSFLLLLSLLIWLQYHLQPMLTPIKSNFLKVMITLFAISYINIGLSNPGFVEPNQQKNINSSRYCDLCDVMKDRNDFHCEDCDVCIKGFDHHCPWTGKCIGSGNLCGFYFFLIMVFGTLIAYFIVAATSQTGIKHSGQKIVG